MQDLGPTPYAVSAETLADVIRSLRQDAVVLDLGCAGWRMPQLAVETGRPDLRHIGADLYGEPAGRPAGVAFIAVERDGDPFATAVADLVVSSHCLEHSRCPIEQFRSLLLACRTGGLVYVETPSEISATLRSEDDPRQHGFGSFWDDPTHVRPFSPGALYRLGLSFGLPALRCGRLLRGGIPCAAAVFAKTGDHPFRYVSLRDVPPGDAAAMRALWPDLTAARAPNG